jgi:hypothetical protein
MTRVFNPVPPPRCEKCGEPMGFVKLDNGKWRPVNPDGTDHWDKCREIRYAKAKTGECREESWTDEDGNKHRIVWWDGGRKPFLVMHSVMGKNQIKPASGGGGLIPLEQHQALAVKHGYTLVEFETPA